MAIDFLQISTDMLLQTTPWVLSGIMLVVFIILLAREGGRRESARERFALRLDEERRAAAAAQDALRGEFDARRDEWAKEKEELLKTVSEKEARVASLQAVLQERTRSEEAIGKEREEALGQLRSVLEKHTLESSKELETTTRAALAQTLAPLQEKFREFAEAVGEHTRSSIDSSARLEQQIKDLGEQSISLGKEARALSDALLGQSKVQGDFGEMLLGDILSSAGMVEGVHYLSQEVIRDEHGRVMHSEGGARMIPDVQVLFPDGGVVVVDSKVSLNAYVAWMDASTAEERKKYAALHVKSVEAHVKELAAKDYASYVETTRRLVDYTIMFIPMEGAFQLMLSESPTLWQEAKGKGVVIVSHMTLLIVLNLIQMSWRQHSQEEHITKVYKTASDLLTALGKWMDCFMKVGDGIDKAKHEYDEAARRLSGSRNSVVRIIQKLESLGTASAASRVLSGEGRGSVVPRALARDVEPDGQFPESSDME